MGVGLAISPRLDRIRLSEREACPSQLKWPPLIQWKSGLKRHVDGNRHLEHSGHTPWCCHPALIAHDLG